VDYEGIAGLPDLCTPGTSFATSTVSSEVPPTHVAFWCGPAKVIAPWSTVQ
jgi:hypothetical protein